MFQALLKKIIGNKNERTLKKMQPMVARVGELEGRYKALDNAGLQSLTAVFKERVANGEPLDDLLPEVFAWVRESASRVLKMRHYDVQVLGGIVLHQGTISEMKTGEGKTLCATLPVVLNALTGKGVHLVTVNDYLARRDAEWMGRLYGFLGMDTGVIVHGLTDRQRQEAYGAHITYGQNNEFGFDYLRDNMKFRLEDYVQRPLHYAIIDEVDSILIDEARTPLIISGPAEGSSKMYYRANAIIPFLKADEDYVADEKARSVALTDSGVDKVEKKLKIDNLFDTANIEVLHHVNTALRAHILYKRDQHYLVEDGNIIIVDDFTGRKMHGRRWSDGLHQAVEAKEGLKVQEENQTLATVTFQNYFRMYEKLSGMTGTADTEAEEFHKIYKLDVLVIPTNRPIARDDDDDLIYTTERGKYHAIMEDIRDCQERGQPVLVGTTSVERNEFLSRILSKENIRHELLNAKAHGREADIVAQAGRPGSVTIATNMAGRGTDIILGGNPELLAADEVGASEGEEFEAALAEWTTRCQKDKKHVLEAGGLAVIGTERHESRRIDNQLRGRSGRQGDPGWSRFYLSLEDDLLRIFGGENLKKWMDRINVPEDEPIVHPWVTKVIESSQRKVEARNFDIRKNLLEYDDVMNQQRTTIYALRRRVLEGREIHEFVTEAVGDVAWQAVAGACPEGALPEEWDIDGLVAHAKTEWDFDLDLEGVDTQNFEALSEHLVQILGAHYEERCRKIADQLYQLHAHETGATEEHYWNRWVEFEQEQLLRTVDRSWRMHLQALDHLREGIHLEAYGQRDPKLVYKKEAFEYFQNLLITIRESVVGTLFRVELRDDAEIERLKQEREEAARKLAEQQQASHAAAEALVGGGAVGAGAGGSAASAHTARAQASRVAQQQARRQRVETIRRDVPKVGRNDPCPCGSGKKYKKCHMLSDNQPSAGTM